MTPVLVFLGVTITFLLSAAYNTASGDVATANAASWQLATTGSPYLDEVDLPFLEEHPLRDVWVVESPDGRELIGRSPGAVAPAIPAYYLFGQGDFTLVPGAVTAAIITGFSVLLMMLALRQVLTGRNLVLATLAFGLTTPVWSVAANGMWPHTITVFGIAGMAWGASTQRWWVVGIFGGITLWGRLHCALIIAVLGILLSWRSKDMRILVATAVPSSALLALQGAWTRWIYQSWNPTASYDTGPFQDYAATNLVSPVNFLGFLIAPDRGMLFWTPLLLLFVPALQRAWRDLPPWTTALFWGGVVYTVVQGIFNRFSGGDAFYGYRITLELLACSVPMLAFAAPRMGRIARVLFGPVLALQALMIAAGAVRDTLKSSVDEVWTRHSFFSAADPAVMTGLVIAALAIGFLGQRIWLDPVPRHLKPQSSNPSSNETAS